MWDTASIEFEIIGDLTSHPVVTVLITTPDGTLRVMAVLEEQGATLVVRGAHVQDARANAVGQGNLMVIARAAMERMGYDGLVVEGAARTTGANPGRRPGPVRFTRRVRASPPPQPGTP